MGTGGFRTTFLKKDKISADFESVRELGLRDDIEASI